MSRRLEYGVAANSKNAYLRKNKCIETSNQDKERKNRQKKKKRDHVKCAFYFIFHEKKRFGGNKAGHLGRGLFLRNRGMGDFLLPFSQQLSAYKEEGTVSCMQARFFQSACLSVSVGLSVLTGKERKNQKRQEGENRWEDLKKVRRERHSNTHTDRRAVGYGNTERL